MIYSYGPNENPFTKLAPQEATNKHKLNTTMCNDNCNKKELATQTKITIEAMESAGESIEFMCMVLYLAKTGSKTPMEVYATMTDTYNEISDYLGDEEVA